MLLTAPSNLTIGIAAAGGLCVFVFIVVVVTRLLTSATRADRHLVSGMAFAPLARGTHVASELGPRIAQPAANGPAESDDPSQQIFAQLNEYYAANISQGNTIFWASLLSMCIGFAIIFAGVISAGTNGVTAIVAAIAGVLSQFIAATFLVVLRSTQQQATAYAQSLVELHLRDVERTAQQRAVALGLQLLGEISADRTNPANPTKASIAMGLIVKPTSTILEPPSVTVEAPSGGEPVTERRNRSGTVTFDDPGTAERR